MDALALGGPGSASRDDINVAEFKLQLYSELKNNTGLIDAMKVGSEGKRRSDVLPS
jgi:hypothetical protein